MGERRHILRLRRDDVVGAEEPEPLCHEGAMNALDQVLASVRLLAGDLTWVLQDAQSILQMLRLVRGLPGRDDQHVEQAV
ncbi:MAG TPA: hypothetical protein EYP49_19475 [Anaerolineae bacterium]|nr:hypothetical protein [Anaerolineae bacterium]